MADATAWISAPIHPTASDWATRVVANGGAAPSDYNVVAISNFCGALDAAAITSLMVTVNVFAPDNLIASITPLIVGIGSDPWTNTAFVDADLTIQGLKGDSSTKYLNCGILFSDVFVDEAGMTAYNTFADNAGTNREIGSGVDSANHTDLAVSIGASAYFDCFTGGAGGRISAVKNLPFGLGFTSGNRTSSTSSDLYTANSYTAFSSIGSLASTAGAPAATSIYIFASSWSSTTRSNKRLSFAAIHHGLTSAQCEDLYDAVQTLRRAFGGGWI